ncbi:PKD-like domain-containing protein [Aquimarina aggregata]|uniref:PKD-like domain-containing protein n=1 Tax=Aquimarina aggregata TaxID=1642818 RepID=UPI00249198A5|nr:PKD-like domain-containing protein [Aquimarina aggregata]
MKKRYFLFLLMIFINVNCFIVYGQLSDVHYLPPLKQGGNNQAIRQQAFYLSTPASEGTFDVDVYQGVNAVPVATITISSTASGQYNVADGDNNISLVTNANTGIKLTNSGLRFESQGGEKFYVNYRGRSGAQATSLTSKGRAAAGTSFKWGGIPNRANQKSLTTSLGIMATEPGTIVTIFGYDPGCEFRVGGNAGGITSNTYTLPTLNAGETFVLEAVKAQAAANVDGWLGATIQSNKKIVISNGGLNVGVRNGAAGRDAGIDQPVPENVLGREYVFIRGNGAANNETEFPIIIATANNTEIFVNGSMTPIAVLNDGDYFEIPGSNYSANTAGANMHVRTTKDVYAYQCLTGASQYYTLGLNFIAPVNCLLPPQLDFIPNIRDVDGKNFNGGVTIVASTSTPDGSISVTDANGTATYTSTPIAGTPDWKSFFIPGLTGDVSITSTGPIAVGFLGASGAAGIAGYFSGFDSVPIVELDVTGGGCLPGSDTFEITGSFDAYQWYQNGAPMPGATNSIFTPTEPGDFFVEVTRGTCTYESAVLSVYNCDPEIVLTKTVDVSAPVLEGDTVTFTVTVESLGVLPVSNLVINDVLPPELTFVSGTPSFGTWAAPNWTIGDMFPGEVHSIAIVATVNEVSAATTVTNTVSNSQNEVEADVLPDDDTEDISIVNSAIEVTKVDRLPVDGSYDTVGELITYDFVVTNTGSTALTNVTITDPNIDAGSLSPASVANLAIGATANFTATHAITQTDLETDQVVNSATANATLSNGFVISDVSDDPDDPNNTVDDPTVTPLDQKGAIEVEKIAQPAQDGLYDTLGEVIVYEITVINTGNVSLDNVVVTDMNADLGSITPVSVANLPVGASAVFMAEHTIVQTDFDNGSTINTARGSGTEPVEGDVTIDDSDDPTTIPPNDATVVSIPQVGQLDVTKVDAPPGDGAFDTVGEVITYTIIATSVGNVTLTNVNLVDPNADTITLQSTTGTDTGTDDVVDSMEPMDTATFIATHIVTQDDLDNAEVVNTATAGGQDPGLGSITDLSDDPDDPNNNINDPTIVPLVSTPSLGITKIADDDSNVTEGQTITYTYVVTNNSNVTSDNVSISDVHVADGTITTPSLQSTTGTDANTADNEIDSLAPGETGTWTATYVVTANDIINQADITNTVTATGTPRTGILTDPTANEIVTVHPVDTICSDAILNHDLTADVNLPGGTFSWIAADNSDVTGETLVSSSAISIDDTLINTSGIVQTVTYTVNALDSGGMLQDTYIYVVTVNPKPFVTTLPIDTVCSNVALNHDLTADVNVVGTTFSWLAADNANVTGETTTVSTATNITDILVNTSGTVQTVTYTITPTSAAPNSCVGAPYTYVVTVNPKPFVATPPTDTTCSNVALNHDLTMDVDLTGTTFNWLAADNPNITGETLIANTATSITDVLTNTSGTVETVTYTITPTSEDGCIGDPYDYIVTINPEPFVATPPTQTICSDIALNHDLTTDVNLAGTTFSWLAADNPNITGETTTTSTTTDITDVLTNISGNVQTVTYTITPTSAGPSSCTGDSYTYIVTVNPEPFVATPPTETICSSVTLNHDLTTDVNLAGSTFSWEAADNANVTGETTTASSSNIVADVLVNTTATQQIVVYTVTPTSADNCDGNSFTYTVTVDPEPTINALSSNTDICSGEDAIFTVTGTPSTLLTYNFDGNPNQTISLNALGSATITNSAVTSNTTINLIELEYTATNCTAILSNSETVIVDSTPELISFSDITECDNGQTINANDGITAPIGITTTWYNAITGGAIVPLPTLTGVGSISYFVELTDPTTSCTNPSRTEIKLELVSPPFPPLSETVCSDNTLNVILSSFTTTYTVMSSDQVNVPAGPDRPLPGIAANITDTYTNKTGVPVTITYNTTIRSGTCINNNFIITVTVNPEPFVATLPTDTTCSNVSLNHDLNTDVNLVGSTFSWLAADNANVTGETLTASSATSITDTLINTSGVVQTVTYTITPTSADGCTGNSYDYVVTVNPEPFVPTPPTDTTCSDVPLNHDLNTDVNLVGATFSWSAVDNPNVTGETTVASTATSITDVLTNTSGVVQMVTYTITPTSVSPNSCAGNSYDYVVTINPEPFVATSPTDITCSDVALNHDLNTDVNLTGVTFSWFAVDNANVTGETTISSNGTSITDTLTNTSGTVQMVTYRITPTSAISCAGDEYTYVVTINPEPFVAIPPTDTTCSDAALNHDLTTDVNLTGVTFSWSAADNPNVTGETTVASTATSITDVLTNTSGVVQMVTYTITPTSAAPNSCAGNSYDYVVTINPEPFVATLPTDTTCSDIELAHDLTTDVNLAGVTFSWVAADNPNVEGETITTSTDALIEDTLENISGAVQTVIYTITPTSAAPNSCVGDAYTYEVTVNPKPFVATPPTDTTCSDVALNHDLNTDVDLIGVTFSWNAADNPNIIGETTTASTATSITDVLTNTSGAVQMVTYTITPTSANGCLGDPYIYLVTVNPEPFVATLPTDMICSDSALNHDLTADVNLTGVTFSWSAADNPNVSGETTATSTATSITDVLTNTSGAVQMITYTITPTSAAPNSCVGNSYDYVVTVNPEPFVATPPTETTCSDAALNHDLNTDVNLTGVTFSWSATDNPNVTGETIATSTTTSITDVLTNTSGAVQMVTYTITPTSAAPNSCAGNSYDYVVTVNPEPFVATLPTDMVCSDAALNHDLSTDVNLTGVTFSWSAADNPNVTGETTATSTATSITDVLTNTSGAVQMVTYTITPTSAAPNSCAGNSYDYVVTVNPEPFVATLPTDMVCSDATLNHDLTTDVNLTGVTFSWSAADNPNVTGETTTTSTVTSITDVLTNTSGAVQMVTYTITPTSAVPNSCAGNSYDYVVTVNPEPFVATPPTDTTCSDATLNHDLTTDVNLTGVTFSWSAADNPNVTGETTTTSTATSITDVLTNTSGAVQMVTYTITPTSAAPNSCVGNSYDYVVTVNPEPFVTTPPTDTTCSDVALNHDLNTDVNLTGVTFSWSATDNPNVTGETTATSTTTSITDVLTNTSGAVQMVTYTITPTSAAPNSCAGNSYDYVVIVNPEPFVATLPTDTTCSDVALNHDLNTDVNLTGVTFSWSAADNPNVTGETTTTSTTTSITDVLTNTSGAVQMVTYTITPTSAAPNSCAGNSYDYVVTVNPEPFVATLPTDMVCSDATLNHDLTTDVNLTGVTFSWSAADNPNVTGETTATSTVTSITDVLTNTSGAVQMVTYTITPTSAAPNSCAGNSYDYVVTVNPEPFVATPPTDTTCSDVALSHDLNTDVNLTGVTFSWSAADNPNVTGETTAASTATSITDVLTNTSGVVQMVTYTITPTSAAPNSCAGNSYDYVVTVNPEPFVATPPTDTTCSDVALNHDLNTDVDLTGVTFSWSAADNPNVNGETTATSTATSITDVLTNTSGAVQIITYTITPTSADGCVGDQYIYVVTVNPEPFVAIFPTDTTCNNVALNHDLTEDVNLNGVAYSWSATDNPNVTGETTAVSTATNITDVLTNTSGAVQTVTYTITPTSNLGCVGDSYTYVVTVNPEAVLVVTKSALPATDGSYDTVGEIIQYQITVENINEVEVSNVVITDPNADMGSISPASITTIPAFGTVTFMASRTINQVDIDAGQVTNSAIATGADSCGTPVTDTSDDPNTTTPDDPTVTIIDQESSMNLVKSADVAPDGLWDEVGEVITYSLTLTNTGNVTLTNINIDDNNADVGSVMPSSIPILLPGETVAAVASHTITQNDLNIGSVSNTASVMAQDPNGTNVSDLSDDPNDNTDTDSNGNGNPDDITITSTPQFALLEVTKSLNETMYSNIGDVLEYTFEITNTGNVTVFDIALDDPIVNFTSPNTITSLAPGEVFMVTASYTVVNQDVSNELVINIAIVNALQPNRLTMISEDSDDPNDPTNTDDDNDGDFEDPTVAYLDTDGDGIPNIDDPDDDNDGVFDEFEQDDDTDGDGIPDSLDNDDDGDGIPTIDENSNPDGDGNPDDAFDSDGDGIPDYLEPNNLNPNAEDGIEVFNAVTPNGDGDHDVLIIANIEKFPKNELKIFNRWGVLVYEMQGYGINGKFFSGESNGRTTVAKERQLPVGTYFYILTYENNDRVVKRKSNYLYINR